MRFWLRLGRRGGISGPLWVVPIFYLFWLWVALLAGLIWLVLVLPIRGIMALARRRSAPPARPMPPAFEAGYRRAREELARQPD